MLRACPIARWAIRAWNTCWSRSSWPPRRAPRSKRGPLLAVETTGPLDIAAVERFLGANGFLGTD